jgi:hypothetical protein
MYACNTSACINQTFLRTHTHIALHMPLSFVHASQRKQNICTQGHEVEPGSSAPTLTMDTPSLAPSASFPFDGPPGEDPELFARQDSQEGATAPTPEWLLPPEPPQAKPHFPPLSSVPLPRPPPQPVPPPGRDLPPGEDASFRAEPLDIPLPPPPPAPPPAPAATDAGAPPQQEEVAPRKKHLVTVGLSAEELRRAEQREKTREARESAEAERRRRLMAAAATAVKQAAPDAAATVPAAPARRAAELRADKARRARTLAAKEADGGAGQNRTPEVARAPPPAAPKVPKPEPSESGEVVDSEEEEPAQEVQSKPPARGALQREPQVGQGLVWQRSWERRRGGYRMRSRTLDGHWARD